MRSNWWAEYRPGDEPAGALGFEARIAVSCDPLFRKTEFFGLIDMNCKRSLNFVGNWLFEEIVGVFDILVAAVRLRHAILLRLF